MHFLEHVGSVKNGSQFVAEHASILKCLHLNSVKILTNLRLDWSWRVSTSVIDKPNPEKFILIGMFLS